MAIPDPFNASNTQTCTYAYDPIARLSSVNCGSVWSQSFTYDFAGNLKKSGSLSFQPNYTDATGITNNRYYSGLTGLSYDNDGNLVNDSFYTYSWDKFGKPTTIGGITAVYDAFGRLVEENNAGIYTQFLYAPFGAKVAAMNGTNLSRAYIPLPGGGTFNNASSVNNYRHPNWLGSITFVSSLTRTMGTDRAYAPYGELYANAGGPTQTFAGIISETHTNLYDAVEREYHSSQGRWISPDPAGLAAADPMNPQSWNRYAYVDGNPLTNVDPDGLVTLPGCEEGGGFGCDLGGGWGGCGALGGPEGDLCTLLLPAIGLWGDGPGGSGSGGSGGGGSGSTGGGTGGSGGGTGGSGGTGGGIANFPRGENLGIPPGVSANWGGILGALLPIDPSCEFGPCVQLGSGYATGVIGNGTAGSPFIIRVYVWAGMHICGDFLCDWHGSSIGPTPGNLHGMSEDTTVEFAIAGAAVKGMGLLPSAEVTASWLNQGRYFRIGFSRKGGIRVFRSVIFGWKHDWWTGGPL